MVRELRRLRHENSQFAVKDPVKRISYQDETLLYLAWKTMQCMYVEHSPRRLLLAASPGGGQIHWASNMTNAKPAAGRQPFRHDARRLDRDEMKRIATRQVRIELDAWQEKTAAKPFNPAMVVTGILAGVAFVFSVMSWLNESTQDKIEKATGPLASRITEMDRRLTGRLDAVDSRIERLEVRVEKGFEEFNEKLENVNAKLGNVNAKVDNVNAKVDNVNAKVDNVNAKVDNVNAKLDLLLKRR
ncbi:hypothetical protein [Cupriavidus oxalaticus]|uniref:Uncharacterized protein n=1 Tax=Cupriavidus oxalaticus TaxID=96344 RepID=A0A4P7LDX8_9BURK|nr:hypothetical protein [Cupriavidus oxalaticus]QBY52379.1 hypothetical protein E0W60_14300 [Cupriavidus oxalaticus]